MMLDVKTLFFGPFGNVDNLNIELFNEKIDEDILAERIKGTLKLTKLDEQLLADFDLKVKIKLICDRCLGEYELQLPIKFKQEYLLEKPEAETEDLYVTRDFKIDVLEPVRQEIITHLPTKKICREDCPGIDYKTEQDDK
jgi:uncharacterized protein